MATKNGLVSLMIKLLDMVMLKKPNVMEGIFAIPWAREHPLNTINIEMYDYGVVGVVNVEDIVIELPQVVISKN